MKMATMMIRRLPLYFHQTLNPLPALAVGMSLSSFSVATNNDADAFSALMSHREGSVLTQDLDSYNQDWSVSREAPETSEFIIVNSNIMISLIISETMERECFNGSTA
jgi:hypothetical protein